MNQGLHAVDWCVLGLYAASTLGIGWFYGRRQSTTSEYFVGGGRVNPVLVGISLFATLLSTVSYLATPGEALGRGPVLLLQLVVLPAIYAFVAYVLLPTYMRHRVTSAYELLEHRLGLGARLLGAGMFVVLRLAWMSLLVYAAARAMTVMLGAPASATPTVVLAITLVAMIYTSLGGLRAVLVTDAVQTALLLGGALLVVAIVSFELSGLSWFPTAWRPSWDVQPFFSADPATRVTVVGTLVSTFVWYVATAGGDQTSVQRFMATRDLRAARRAYAVQLASIGIVTLVLTLVGFALLGYFEAFPGRLPSKLALRENADDVFPFFIANRLPIGVSGLVVSAMFAAAMSSVDSGVNSIAAVGLTDVVRRFSRRSRTDREDLSLARWIAVGVGVAILAGSSVIHLVPGNITEMTSKTSNLLMTPLFALFVFALFVPFARRVGVYAGTVCGVATAFLIAFSGPLFGLDPETGGDPVSFQWIAPASLLVNLTIGAAVSAVSAWRDARS